MKRDDLHDCLRFLRAQHHILRERPALFFQQAASQPEASGPGRLAAERARRGLERRPWLRWVNKPDHWDPCLVTFLRGGRKSGFAFSPDSRRVIAGWNDASLEVFDAETGREVVMLRPPEREYHERNLTVTGCSFAADGARIVTWIEDGTLKLWDAATGDEIATLARHEEGAGAWGIAPNGVRVAAAFRDGLLKIWNTKTGELETRASGGQNGIVPHRLVLSRDGLLLASVFFHGAIELFETDTGRRLPGFAAEPALVSAEFSADRQRLLVLHDGLFFAPAVWTLGGGKIAEFRGHRERVTACAFSPDADRVMTASMDRTLKLWSSGGEEMMTLTGHREGVLDCAFSPDGRLVASASHDRTLKLWDSESGRDVGTFTGHATSVSACTFSPDGSRIISTSNETTRVWDAFARTGPLAIPDPPPPRRDSSPVRSLGGRFDIALTDRGTLTLIDRLTRHDVCEFSVRNRLTAFSIEEASGLIAASDEWGATYVIAAENVGQPRLVGR